MAASPTIRRPFNASSLKLKARDRPPHSNVDLWDRELVNTQADAPTRLQFKLMYSQLNRADSATKSTVYTVKELHH